MGVLFYILFAIGLLFPFLLAAKPLVTQEFVDSLRARGVKWKVAEPSQNVFQNATLEEFRKFLNPLYNEPLSSRKSRTLQQYDTFGNYYYRYFRRGPKYQKPPLILPVNYDLRQKLQNCSQPAVNQGNCSSCWAIVIAHLVSDRFCLRGINVSLSIQDLLECNADNQCCGGGYASKGYKHMVDYGAVEEKCKSYDRNCGTCRNIANCTRYRCKKDSIWFSDDVEETKLEIYKNGPVGAVFDVYEDFTNYAGGVYYHTKGEYIGAHAVEVVGWGRDKDGMEYWLCKNSWGSSWGMNGYFMIRIGDCEVNDFMSACKPLLSK
eukprot:TRINITY_DN89518_c0_g1_i1.p1 TRINITY_DN89518_c0_g1~~TRINITY_DN89518_c0_g1_i1.p1  ORF type:complete len:367 (+),score=5.55 TRINITY_DN89518_c0_g1_i1:144-1103(+)